MLKIDVQRPKEVTLGRTQSYRLIIQAELLPEDSDQSSSSSVDDGQVLAELTDARVFIVSEDENGLVIFERVAEPIELSSVPTAGPIRRTDRLDLWLPAGEDGIGDLLLEALVEDVRQLLGSLALRTVRVSLSGAGV